MNSNHNEIREVIIGPKGLAIQIITQVIVNLHTKKWAVQFNKQIGSSFRCNITEQGSIQRFT